jgi:hypothetical protein
MEEGEAASAPLPEELSVSNDAGASQCAMMSDQSRRIWLNHEDREGVAHLISRSHCDPFLRTTSSSPRSSSTSSASCILMVGLPFSRSTMNRFPVPANPAISTWVKLCSFLAAWTTVPKSLTAEILVPSMPFFPICNFP